MSLRSVSTQLSRTSTALARRAQIQFAIPLARRCLSTTELNDRQAGRQRVVVLGAGWAANSCVRGLSPQHYQSVVISPRPYFVFTPLLASTAVGTLEPRAALESTRSLKGAEFWEAAVKSIDFDKKELQCVSALQDWDPNRAFSVKYDKLVIAVGAHNQTFNIPGVSEHAFFLKETKDAMKIRSRILQCFEKASLPSTTEEEKQQLLHFCIVGGGPTGVEFAAELHDLIHDDLARHYPTLKTSIKISLYDVAPRILSMFDSALAEYATNHFARQEIEVHTQRTVTKVEDGILHLKEEAPVKFGMLVWSTGLRMTPLVKELEGVRKDPKAGRIMVDEYLRVLAPIQDGDVETGIQKTVKGVYALGDCSVIDGHELPATAQVASQQGNWLRKRLNLIAKRGLLAPVESSSSASPKAASLPTQMVQPIQEIKEKGKYEDLEANVGRAFRYHNILTLAYLGSWNAIAQRSKGLGIRGRFAWLLWRGAYMTKTISLRNKIRVPFIWVINFFFGRDITHL